MKNFVGCGMKLFVLFMGIASLVAGIKYLSVDSSNLVATQAQVISSTWSSSDDMDTDTYSVRYTYQVDGVQYEGSISSPREYAPGEMLTVYYDPAAPDWTFESQGETGLLGIVGLLFGLFCIGSLGWGVIKARLAKRKGTPLSPENPGTPPA